jgi:methyl-accepting chemotaxis protein
MTLVAIVPLGVIWLVNLQTTRAQLALQVDERLGQTAESLVSYVDSWVEMNQRMLEQNAELGTMRSMRPEAQESVLRSIVRNYDWNYLAFTVDPDGNNIARSDGKALRYYGDRSYVRQVLDGAPLGQQVLIGKTSGLPALVLAVPIVSDPRRLEGILAIAMTVADISRKVVDTRIGDSGEAFLLDQEGRVIAHRSEEFARTRKDLQQHPAFIGYKARGQEQLVYEDANDERQIAFVRETQQGWILVVKQDYAEAFAGVRQANEFALALLLVTAVLVVFASYLLSKGMSLPIIRLTQVAEQISHGDMGTEIVGTERRDEIGSLARAIERLGVSVRLAMRRLARAD